MFVQWYHKGATGTVVYRAYQCLKVAPSGMTYQETREPELEYVIALVVQYSADVGVCVTLGSLAPDADLSGAAMKGVNALAAMSYTVSENQGARESHTTVAATWSSPRVTVSATTKRPPVGYEAMWDHVLSEAAAEWQNNIGTMVETVRYGGRPRAKA